MSARWSAFLVWALVAASAVAWGLKLFVRPLPVPAQTAVAVPAAPPGGDWTRVLGAAPPPPPSAVGATVVPAPESARFQLIGVVAPRPAAARSEGVALIAVDGKAPRAYRVGAVIDGEHVLQSVQARAAAIGPRQGPAVVTLELPQLPPPATGVPPTGPAAAPGPSAMVPPPPANVPAPGFPPVTAPAPGSPPATAPGFAPAPRVRAFPPAAPVQPMPAPVIAVPVEPPQGGEGVVNTPGTLLQR